MSIKSEKEKMLSGEFYSCMDKELTELRMRSRKLCKEFNDCCPDDEEKRTGILRKILNFDDEITFLVCEPVIFDYGFTTKIGKYSYVNHNGMFNDNGGVTIGDYTMIGPNCSFYTAVHPLDAESRVYPFPSDNEKGEKALPIKIGNRCWIAGSVVILPGVTIGDDSVIGAGSVVASDIPSGVLAYGNPCKVIRKIK